MPVSSKRRETELQTDRWLSDPYMESISEVVSRYEGSSFRSSCRGRRSLSPGSERRGGRFASDMPVLDRGSW